MLGRAAVARAGVTALYGAVALNCPLLHSSQVIGDGAITGGMAYEAMNHAGFLDKNMIVILNDNQQVGGGWQSAVGLGSRGVEGAPAAD